MLAFAAGLPLAFSQPAALPGTELQQAIALYTGVGGIVDDPRARLLLEQAAARNEPLAVMWLARVYSTGRMTFPADKPRAQAIAATVIDDIETLAEAGNTEAMFLMGTAHAEALGRNLDAELAVAWYRRAAAEAHVLAQHNLGNVYRSGTGVPQSDALAVYWWRLAAEQGDAIPQLRLAEMLEQGLGVEADPDQAIGWYRAAAGRGNPDAQAALERLGAAKPPQDGIPAN